MRVIQVVTAAVVGVAGGVLARREWKRVNRELDLVRARESKGAPVLRRDAQSGQWRPSR